MSEVLSRKISTSEYIKKALVHLDHAGLFVLGGAVRNAKVKRVITAMPCLTKSCYESRTDRTE